MNDANNWNRKWQVDGVGAVCLLGKSPEPEKLTPWAFDDAGSETIETDTKSRLWSGRIPAKAGMQCLLLNYKISDGPAEELSLGLLQRQEGLI